MSFSRTEWVAMGVASLGALWATLGNWIVTAWMRRNSQEDVQDVHDRNQDQRLLQLESDHKAHNQQDDLRFGFIQQSVARIEEDIKAIRVDVADLRRRQV